MLWLLKVSELVDEVDSTALAVMTGLNDEGGRLPMRHVLRSPELLLQFMQVIGQKVSKREEVVR